MVRPNPKRGALEVSIECGVDLLVAFGEGLGVEAIFVDFEGGSRFVVDGESFEDGSEGGRGRFVGF